MAQIKRWLKQPAKRFSHLVGETFTREEVIYVFLLSLVVGFITMVNINF